MCIRDRVFGEEARVHYRNVHGFSGTVTADALNVRSAQSLEGSVLGSEAVSYTPLDVYKRQGRDCGSHSVSQGL